MKVAFYTLGCKVNQYETQWMLEQMKNAGYTVVSCENQADVYVINSCTVTSSGDQKSRQMVRHYKRLYPNAIVVLTGCMPQAYPKIAEELIEADIVLGNNSNSSLVSAIRKFQQTKQRVCDIVQHEPKEKFFCSCISEFEERTRAFVKIQDGCNRFCTYCIIPKARGRVRSRNLKELKTELEVLANHGYKEVVLVGINLSSYGSDNGTKFSEAVSLANSISGIERVRLGSLEPDHLTENVICELAQSEKLCPQFHISLQSGCNSTLERMHRRYTAEEYEKICYDLRSTFPDTALTTDVMVGFPGETEEEFEQSLDFVKKIGFAKLHVFPYSSREGTAASRMINQVTRVEKKERCHRMISIGQNIRKEFLKKQVGKIFPVLFETTGTNDVYEGYTPNYTPVHVYSKEKLCGKMKNIKIIEAAEDWCIGILDT